MRRNRPSGAWAVGRRCRSERDRAGRRGDRAEPCRSGLRLAVAARSLALGCSQAVCRCRAAMPRRARCKRGPPRLIAVAMMRYGDKLASYRLLGEALARSARSALVVGGDRRRRGPERGRGRALAARGAGRSGAAGSSPAAIAARLAAADICVWPALNEAFGMALLEAQASGLPVVAGDGGGVGEIVAHGVTGLLVPPGDASAFAAAVRSLIVDRGRRAAFAQAAQQRVRAEHDIPAAARRLHAVIRCAFDAAGSVNGEPRGDERLRLILCPAPARDRASAARLAHRRCA